VPVPFKKIKTDIKGQYAAIATTYGEGKVVLFGPHPERKTFFDGYVEEVTVRPKLAPFTWFIYNWISNNSSIISYNWWMLRRSVAWLAGCEMPYMSEIASYIIAPKNGVYFNGRKIIDCKDNIVIGHMNLIGASNGANETLVYVNDELIHQTMKNIDLTVTLSKGYHHIRVVAKGRREEAGSEIGIIVMS
jgi:hypothetical protein